MDECEGGKGVQPVHGEREIVKVLSERARNNTSFAYCGASVDKSAIRERLRLLLSSF